MAIYDLQWDLKSLGCDYSGVVSDFLQATRALAPAEQIPKLQKQIERMQRWLASIQEKSDAGKVPCLESPKLIDGAAWYLNG